MNWLFEESGIQTEALVDKAAALIDKNGKAAFIEFRKKASGFTAPHICSPTI
jgi:hypothetical protein